MSTDPKANKPRRSAASRRSDAARIADLEARVEAQASLIREQAASLAHSRKIFDRSSAAARIGVWECRLADQSLQWTDVVYDIFDLPRGSALDRQRIVECYTPESARELQIRRSRAIEERSGFGMDAEIITAKGVRRWMRITATVECEDGVPVRIFGMKQDITEEKIQADRTRYLAEFDVMTGLANRGQFQSKLLELGQLPSERKPPSALLLVDLDEFKKVNDTAGHAVGDEYLKEVAVRLRGVCGEAELVARIGGDEFAILVAAHLDLQAISELARSIIDILSKPIRCGGGLHKLGASVGIALFDKCAPSQLFVEADTALYAAKAAGRNTYRIFKPGHDTRVGDPRVAA
jgi:diguanylate cyclase (GGDEF)-like protein